MNLKYPLVLIYLFWVGTALGQSSTMTLDDITSALESEILSNLDEDGINGSISVAIYKKDSIIWSKAFGPVDSKALRSSTSSTIFRTGSISKTITAFLMMQLVEEGVINLDDPVEKYFADVKQLDGYGKKSEITFRQLASHTSGLIREPKLRGAATGPIDEWELKILESIPKTSFKTDPGTEYSYSNIGYGILGLALSKAAERPFRELVTEYIFEKLDMDHSFFVVPKDRFNELSQGIAGGPNRKTNMEIPYKEHEGRGYKVPNGGIYSTPEDLCKFMIASELKGILTSTSRNEMTTRQTPAGSGNYGLGYSLMSSDSLNTAGHGGSVAGYTAHMRFDKDSEFGIAIMRNYNSGSTNLGRFTINALYQLKSLDR